MKVSRRLATCLVLAPLVLLSLPAAAASPKATPTITSCTTTATSVTVRWVTANSVAGKEITGYGIVTLLSESATRTFGRRARSGTVHGLIPRTAYRVQLVPFVNSGFPTIRMCLAYTKTLSGRVTTPMHHPSLTTATATATTVTVTWTSGQSGSSALPSSYEVSVSPEDTNTAPTITMPEPLSVHSATFTGLMPGTSYYIGLGAVNAWGEASVTSLIETPEPISTTTSTTLPTTSTTTMP